jgi:hypothetical protein
VQLSFRHVLLLRPCHPAQQLDPSRIPMQ